jgi:DNA-binding PucR family transcriptional regulator
MVDNLNGAQRRLEASGFPLAVGMSTVHAGIAAVPGAYREAAESRRLLRTAAGVMAMPTMSAFDYLVRQGSPAALRIIRQQINQFVADDIARGRTLITTLDAYVSHDLNVSAAAKALHIHVNTARYRLTKIAEQTGADLRHVGDLMELLIAARIAEVA